MMGMAGCVLMSTIYIMYGNKPNQNKKLTKILSDATLLPVNMDENK